MNLLESAPDWLTLVLFVLLLAAAVQDGWHLRISNWISAGIAIGAFIAVALDGPVSEIWQNLLLFAALLAVGTYMFGRGWMGGGDIKLLASCALWFDLTTGWKALVAIAIAGGVEALAILMLRRLPIGMAAARRLLLLRAGEGIPYGIAIAMGVAFIGWWLRA